MNEQKSYFQPLALENRELQHDLEQVGKQIAALEEQVFALEDTLRKICMPSVGDKAHPEGVSLPDVSDPISLARENVCLQAKLGYVHETIARIEETLLHLCDALER